jgi:hypothetical protein
MISRTRIMNSRTGIMIIPTRITISRIRVMIILTRIMIISIGITISLTRVTIILTRIMIISTRITISRTRVTIILTRIMQILQMGVKILVKLLNIATPKQRILKNIEYSLLNHQIKYISKGLLFV